MNRFKRLWPTLSRKRPNDKSRRGDVSRRINGTLLLVLVGVALAPLILTFLVGCSRKKETPTVPPPTAGTISETDLTATAVSEQPQSIVILVGDEIETLDPYRMISIHPEGSVAYHLWDTLTLLNDDLNIESNLAQSWRLINNFTWEFSLRQGITFHNGEPVDAQAIRFSVERAQAPNSLETLAQDTALQRVEVVDDHTVRFVTSRPNPNLAYHLASLEILPPSYYSENDADQLAQAPLGSGPYQVAEYVAGERVVLEAVPTYWKGAPVWPEVVFQTIPDVAQRLQLLGEGTATLATDLPPIKRDEWDTPSSQLETIESTQRMLVGIHAAPGSPLANQDIRQALNYAIDVETIVQEWLQGYGTRYGSWVNPPANNVQLQPWPHDLERAAELLAQGGYPEGFATTLVAPREAYYQSVGIAERIADQLGQVGVTVQVEIVDWETFAGRLLSTTPPPLFLLAMNSRGDALQDTRNLSRDFRFNTTGWENSAFEEAVARAQNSFNDSARSRALNDAQAIAYESAPWVWLWRTYRFYGVAEQLDWTPRRDGLVHVYGFQAP